MIPRKQCTRLSYTVPCVRQPRRPSETTRFLFSDRPQKRGRDALVPLARRGIIVACVSPPGDRWQSSAVDTYRTHPDLRRREAAGRGVRSNLTFEDLATVDPKTKYIEARRHIPSVTSPHTWWCHGRVGVGQPLVLRATRRPRGGHAPTDCDTGRSAHGVPEKLENYLNAQPPGRPYLDYRPEVGPSLFPSPRTGAGLSKCTVNRICRQHRLLTDPEATEEEKR
jgi:hypothetical protein